MSKESDYDFDYTQLDISGEPTEGLPKVRTSDGYVTKWDRDAIVKQLTKETKLTEFLFDIPPISEELAEEVAKEAERRIRRLNVEQLSGPLIREVVNNILLEHGRKNGGGRAYRNVSTRVGTPVYDAFHMDVGTGFESNENANLIGNPETSHKKKADKISKEQYLLTMPSELADAHLSGDLHIHDLEYFATRPFCMDWDLRYFLYYGLMPDGSGRKSSVAGPAKKPEVAILHAVKALGSAQTNWAGGQGFYNFLTFLAPYVDGLSYGEIKQLMQMFVYEMTQMMVARGGQLVFSSVQLTPGVPDIWKDKPVVKHGKVGPDTYGSYDEEVQKMFSALMEVMIEGDYWGKPFNFPKPEVNIKEEFLTPEYDEQWDLAYKLAAKYGTPYFDNEIPDYRGGDEGISCYQCLSRDEYVAFEEDGDLNIERIDKLFERAKQNGIDTDPTGVEFAPLEEVKAPSMNKKGELETKPFAGVMRKEYEGELVELILDSNRRIKVTPDHPVFHLEGGIFKKTRADEIEEGHFLPAMGELSEDKFKEGYNGAECESIQERVKGKQLLASQARLMENISENKVCNISVKEINRIEYTGYVYDLVDVEGNHNFSNGSGIITGNCCAYQFSASDETDSKFEEKLHFEDGHHFTMGGWQVITLNCPRAAYRAEGDDDKLIEELKHQMDTAVDIFNTKKRWMNLMQENRRLPFAMQRPKDPNTREKGKPAADLSQLVWTIGVLGINDMAHYHTGEQMHESQDSLRFALRVMAEMEKYARHLEEEHGMDIALARTPAESTVQRFAVSDLINENFKNKAKTVVRGDFQKAKGQLKRDSRDVPVYYTNGTHVPVDADVSLGKRIDIEHKFFPVVDGGNIMHIWLGESHPDPDGLRSFTENIANKTQAGYFAYTKDMTVCNQDFNVENGLKDICTTCGSDDIDYISRVTGYLQSVGGWNEAKKQELQDRKKYKGSDLSLGQ